MLHFSIKCGVHEDKQCLHVLESLRQVSLLRIFAQSVLIWSRMFLRTIVAFLLSSVCIHAADSFAVHDSTLRRGQHSIAVYANLSTGNSDSCCLDLQYNPMLLSISGADALLPAIKGLEFLTERLSSQLALLHLRFSTDSMHLVNEKLLSLRIEVLAGPDSVCTIAPTYACKNGVAISPVSFSTGVIHIEDGIPVRPVAMEWLGVAYPQPGSSQQFRYRLLQACSPQFTMFNSAGKLILNENLSEQPAGEHLFSFSSAYYASLCDAVYFLRLVTPMGVYVVPFEVIH